MTNGLGVSFGGLMLMASLAGLASILTLAMVAVSIVQRSRDTFPRSICYLAALLSGGALLITGLAVRTLSYKPAALAIVLHTLVVNPVRHMWAIPLPTHDVLSPINANRSPMARSLIDTVD